MDESKNSNLEEEEKVDAGDVTVKEEAIQDGQTSAAIPVVEYTETAEELRENVTGKETSVDIPLIKEKEEVERDAKISDLAARETKHENQASTEDLSARAEPSIERIESSLPVSHTNAGALSSGVAESVPKEITNHFAQSTETRAGDDDDDDTTEVPRSIENQPLVAATLPNRNSWMNCCGIFDFLKRSDQQS